MPLKQSLVLSLLLITCGVFAQDKKPPIGIVFNPTYAYRSLAGSDEEFEKMLDDVEGPMFGFDAGIYITVLKKARLELVTGLLYSKQGFYLGDFDLLEMQLPPYEFNSKAICDFLQVPVRINYRVKEESKFYFIGGVTNDFLLDSRIEGDSPYNLAVEGNRKYNIALNIGFGYDFRLSDKITLALEPNLKYQLLHFRTDDLPAERHLYAIGMAFNTKFRL